MMMPSLEILLAEAEALGMPSSVLRNMKTNCGWERVSEMVWDHRYREALIGWMLQRHIAESLFELRKKKEQTDG
jgi:hypothetical protein